MTNRVAFADEWPLAEFWQDKILQERKFMDGFTEPLMLEALAKREADMRALEKVEDEDLTLLSHLVRHTQDPKVIQDELVNLLVAGRDTVCLSPLFFDALKDPFFLTDRSAVDLFRVHASRAP